MHFRTFILYTLLFLVQASLFGQSTDLYKAYVDELNLARKTKDFHQLASSYYKLALYEEQKNRNFERSFEYLSRALEYYKVTNDTTGMYDTEYHIARQLLENGMYNDALDELLDLKVYYLGKDDQLKLAEVELQLFKLYLERLDVEKAKSALDFIGVQLQNLEAPDLTIKYLIGQIQYYELMKAYDQALELSNLCFEKSAASGNEEDKANCLASRGDIYLKYEMYDVAILDYLSSLTYLELVPFSKKRLSVYENLSNCYKAMDSLENALYFTTRYAALQDSILNENRVIAVNNITYKYESRQKSTEIKLLEREKAIAEESNQQQKRALIVLGLVLGLLTIGIYYIVRFYNEKINTARIIEEQNEKINQQKITELKDRIQINSMKSMIEGQEVERERIAKDLHDSLGGLLSTIKLQVDNIRNKVNGHVDQGDIDTATNLLDTAVGEVRTISQNLQPGALSRLGLIPAVNDLVNRYNSGYGPEIDFQHFEIPMKLDTTISLGIYRIVQEILNNAIKHASAQEILVQLNRQENDIIIHIEDDGVGFNQDTVKKGMGLENIRSRVNYLKGIIEIDSRQDEGTSFIIRIPLNLEMVS